MYGETLPNPEKLVYHQKMHEFINRWMCREVSTLELGSNIFIFKSGNWIEYNVFFNFHVAELNLTMLGVSTLLESN